MIVRKPVSFVVTILYFILFALVVGVCVKPRVAEAGAALGGPSFTAIPMSVPDITDEPIGSYTSPMMSIEVAFHPRNEPKLNAMLAQMYTPGHPLFHHWLSKNAFNTLFSPDVATIAAATRYLTSSGLIVNPSNSPFFLRATGSSAAISTAFQTDFRLYRNAHGDVYFANASQIQLPRALAPQVLSVIGFTDTVHHHTFLRHIPHNSDAGYNKPCETSYPTNEDFFAYFNFHKPLTLGYGGGPNCSGLTPSQINSIYGAPVAGPQAQGADVTLGVFELAAYQSSDIDVWAHHFYGPAFTPPLVNISVDGGPTNPSCPASYKCAPKSQAYNGDAEVDADIEMELTISPAAQHILVYLAPNDNTGQTSLDELNRMADDDRADVISSSWGLCEPDVGVGYARAENVIFEHMAMQGQSFLGAAGDDGSFDCLTRTRITHLLEQKKLNVDDPPSQPWVTSVGGTSFGSFNPGTNATPKYPAGVETVWNIGNLCNSGPNEGGVNGNVFDGYFWCYVLGAGGGGNSKFWGRPFFQAGPSLTNAYSTYGNGTTNCKLAPMGTACRELPDVSANADEITPDSDYCTGNASTPGSNCTGPYFGWGGSGGTSLAAPLWAGIIADRDGYIGARVGSASQFLYTLYAIDPTRYFHDITGVNQTTNNNGTFPTTRGFDLATGMGSPIMSAIITGKAQP